uniref:Uncharacterized protein n=1 Tax=Bos indicus x Bos taurus TaxID=30522 RepID=A0A4W2IM66_BOBOX
MKTRIRGIKKKNKAEEKTGSRLKAQEDANPVLLPLEDHLSLSGDRESAVILYLPVTEPKAGVLPLLQRRRKKFQSSQSHQ